jgi:hypothetical protein
MLTNPHWIQSVCTANMSGRAASVFMGQQPPSGPGPPYYLIFMITQNDAPQSVGLLWTRHQLVADTST